MPILNYSTKIDYYKTISEIHQILVKGGVKKFIIDNNDKGLPVSITFSLIWQERLLTFALPCKFQGVLKAMQKGKVAKSLCTEQQALRVGWRIVKDWVQAQMAIVEAELAQLSEVFLPYAVTQTGDTLFEYIQNRKNDTPLLLT